MAQQHQQTQGPDQDDGMFVQTNDGFQDDFQDLQPQPGDLEYNPANQQSQQQGGDQQDKTGEPNKDGSITLSKEEYAKFKALVDAPPPSQQSSPQEIARAEAARKQAEDEAMRGCLLYTSPSPRDRTRSRMPSSA